MEVHFSGLIIWRRDEKGICVLLQDCTNTNPGFYRKKEAKFPGGTNKQFGEIVFETPLDTLYREIKEETWLKVQEDPVFLTTIVRSGHKKHFYYLEYSKLSGKLRDVSMKDEDSYLSAPYWARAEYVPRLRLGGDHRLAFARFEVELLSKLTL